MHARSEVLLTGSGDVFRQSILDLNVIRRDPVRLGGYAYRIRGAERNDIALIGDASMMWTWNGFSWRRHGQIANMDDRLYGLAISATLIVAAGTRFGSALNRNGLVWIGRRWGWCDAEYERAARLMVEPNEGRIKPDEETAYALSDPVVRFKPVVPAM
jgi:hypothetical protein